MFIQFYRIHSQLQDFVSNLMVYNPELGKGQPLPVHVHPPIPEHSLYFYPRDPCISHNVHSKLTHVNPPSIIVGPSVERVNLSFGYDHIVIRVGFHPGGLHRLLGLPMHELFNLTVNSQDLIGQEIAAVHEQLNATKEYHQMKNIVEAFLLSKTKKLKGLENYDRIMAHLMNRDGKMQIEELACETCLSYRQFERKCKERIGMPPKLFVRLIRFSKAYRVHETHPDLSWTTIAHANGYFDQAHFVRDFKEFAGVAPTFIDEELARTTLRLQAPFPF